MHRMEQTMTLEIAAWSDNTKSSPMDVQPEHS